MAENIPRLWFRIYCANWIAFAAWWEAVFPPTKTRSGVVLPFRRRA
jgi:hypothetical protein